MPSKSAPDSGDGLPSAHHGFQRRLISESTPLLAAATNQPYAHHGTDSPDETFLDDELQDENLEIDPNEFDHMLTKSISYSSGLGIEPASQESSMLRGPRRRESSNGLSRVSSQASRRSVSRRRSTAGEGEGIPEEEEEEEEETVKWSPYLGGVSVARFWLIYTGVLANLFVGVFDTTILASSHPVITSYFHSSNNASWLSTAFLLTSTAFQPLFGRLSDTMGRKPPYVFSLTIFLVSTVWCALSQSMTEFIVARAFCGLGAGGTMVMGSIITSDLVPIEIRGNYQSYINIVYGLGAALGAACGGWIADSLGWRWEFGIQVPLLAICLMLAIVSTPRTLGMKEGVAQDSLRSAMSKFDYKGSLLMTTSITTLILGLNLGGNIYPWSHPLVISSLVVFVTAFSLFIFVESRTPLPIMPLSLITRAPRANLIMSNFLASVIVNSILFNIPLFFQAVLLTSATTSGLRLVAPTIASAFAGISTGFLITKFKRLKWPIVLGATLILIGTICLSSMTRDLPTWLYLLFIVPSSMGQGFQFPGTFIALLSVSEQAEQAVVTSTLTLWRSLGMVLGVSGSSLGVQNGLVYFLDRMVDGPDKARVIEEVRKSIQAIAALPPHYRMQAISAYAASLKATFMATAVLALISLVIVLPIKMPRLGKRM